MTRRRRSDLVHVSAYVAVVLQHQAAGVPVPTSGDDRPGINDTTIRMIEDLRALDPEIREAIAETMEAAR